MMKGMIPLQSYHIEHVLLKMIELLLMILDKNKMFLNDNLILGLYEKEALFQVFNFHKPV